MTDRFKYMDAEDLSKLIDYIVKHDAGNNTVGDIKAELGLTIAGKNTIDKKLNIIGDILKRKSISAIKKERLKGWGAA